MRVRYSICLLLAAVTLAIFWQIRNHEFVWRDRAVILENLNGRAPAGLTASSPTADLSRILTYPVWSAVAGLPESAGDPRQIIGPRPFHTASILLHVLSALVVFGILRSLVPHEWAAGAGALLFALHPLQVELVASASGMIHLLGGLLALTALVLQGKREEGVQHIERALQIMKVGRGNETLR